MRGKRIREKRSEGGKKGIRRKMKEANEGKGKQKERGKKGSKGGTGRRSMGREEGERGGGGEGKFPRLKVKQPTTAPEKVKGKKDKNKKETGETHYTAKVERPTYEGKLRKNFTLYNGK